VEERKATFLGSPIRLRWFNFYYEKRLGILKIAILLAPRLIVLSSVPVNCRFLPFFGANTHEPVLVMCFPGFTRFAIFYLSALF
jgi:hypothetical protein